MFLALLATCIDPVAFGATPGDGSNDTPAFQHAIDEAIHAGADVCIGPGVWSLERNGKQISSLSITGGPVTLRGAGPSTVLRMTGPGRRHDWDLLYIRKAAGVVIRDLTIDGLDAYDTEEQTHLIQLAPDAVNIVVANATLGPMRQPTERVGKGIGGDCLRMLGEPGHEVHDVTIVDTRFVDCDRAAIGFQRAVTDVTVAFSTISGTGDAAIDFEPTGRGVIRDVTLANLEIHNPSDGQSAYAITLAGVGQDLAEHLVVAHSTLDGGGIGMLNVGDVLITDNTITSHPKSREQPTISMIRRGTDIRIVHNTIERDYKAEPAFVIRAAHNAGIAPQGITIEDNTITQGTSLPVIGAISVSDVTVHHNVIDYAAGAPGVAVVQASAITDMHHLVIADNEIRGQPAAVLLASPRAGTTIEDVTLARNKTQHVAALRCNADPVRFHRIAIDEPLPEGTGCNGIEHPTAPQVQIQRSPAPGPQGTVENAKGIVVH